jgi:thiamine biosynthesis lipoprotein
MGTLVTIQILGAETDSLQTDHREKAIERAFAWFRRVEDSCTRFNPQSEAMRLTAQVGTPVAASATLYEAVHFALAVARESDGAFDPTVGHAMEARGFNREYRTGQTVRTSLQPGGVSYRDVSLDPDRKTITLLRPLILDLGAVAKGMAVDLAARELQPFGHFAIDAGGDLYLGGRNMHGDLWSVGIRHPRRDDEIIDTVRVSDRAVCTSGDYERPAEAGGHHILDPRSGESPHSVASVTVIAPTAMLADAVATAAFVLGPADGIRLFDSLGVDGLIISPALERFATRGMRSDYQLGGSAILSHAQRPSHDRPGDSARSGDAV